MSQISAEDFITALQKSDYTIIDVRTPNEFSLQHIPQSLNIPLDEIEAGHTSQISQDKPLFLICHSGNRSQRAYHLLKAQGFKNIFTVSGGIAKCGQISNHVKKISSTLPLMRQVQIVAGGLVLLSIILSFLIDRWFISLGIFVGIGQIFAGVSGFCGMARLLEKMPWNKITLPKKS